jgi:hypothetical protein
MKIKISLELEGEEFKYDWEIGGERHAGSIPFGSDHLAFISSVIETSKRVKAYKQMMSKLDDVIPDKKKKSTP